MLASELIAQVRLMGSVTPDLSDTDLLLHADMEVQSRLLPMLRTVSEEYLVRTLDVVASGGRVALPPRATGAAVRLVQLVTTGQLLVLPRVDPAHDPGAMPGSSAPWGFYFDGGGIVLLPSSSSGTVRVRYYARPGKLVLETNSARTSRITNVVTGATTTVLTIGTFIGGAVIDIVSSGPAHQHVAVGITASGSSPTLTVNNADLLETPQIGDYVATADYSPFVSLPEELGSVLVLRTAARILAALGYTEEAAYHEQRSDIAQAESFALLRPRSDGNPKRLSGGMLASMASGTALGWRRW